MELSSRYNPLEIEDKWYNHWERKGYFKSVPDEREPYSIVIPPPNVTGVLHMGHMLNNTIQDILIRKAKQQGKNTCWVPGTDHASIATEAKVVKMLREKGIKKSDLTRDEFLGHAWQWKEEYGGIILSQLRKLGASCDWDRTAFTMDKVRSEAVIKVFVDLYKKGKLYRGKRMVNWDPEAKTVLSNEEVIYGLENSRLFFVLYQVKDSDEKLIVATTRPETIPGDTAVAVNPNDPRYKHLHGKKVIVPLVGREVPVIADDYVDMEFGTGALKVTPAHDVNDYEIGKRHQLEVVDVFNDDGTMSNAAGIYPSEDRFIVRKKFAKDLENAGFILKIEDYQNNVGRSERTNAVVEPRLSLQWYVDMAALAKPALEAVMDDTISFFPKNQKNVYRHWMENIKDWCISRQLWWGHQIPAWYIGEEVYVAETVSEALEEAREKRQNPGLKESDLKQDDDVLDTWFSSWLWPISVFDGFASRKELDYYYPTSVLVTGWDIIFLWVARMIMAGYEWENEKPFHHVYFTGMVRDKLRRKMSKSLGNSPDALKLIEDYGADGVRFGMMSCSPAGGDLLFDEKLCEQGRNFCNKLWNALRLIQGWEVDINSGASASDKLAYEWMEHKFRQIQGEVDQNFKEYRLSEALMTMYSYAWSDFCSWYLEIIKPESSIISLETKNQAIQIYRNICLALHPYMPFITEEIWNILYEGRPETDCMVAPVLVNEPFNSSLISKVEQAKDIITQIRDARNKHSVKMKDPLPLYMDKTLKTDQLLQTNGWKEIILKMGNISNLTLIGPEEIQKGVSFISETEKCIVGIISEENPDETIEALQKDLEYQIGFVASVEKKLSNEKFVQGAAKEIVDRERAKLADGRERIRLLQEQINQLKS